MEFPWFFGGLHHFAICVLHHFGGFSLFAGKSLVKSSLGASSDTYTHSYPVVKVHYPPQNMAKLGTFPDVC